MFQLSVVNLNSLANGNLFRKSFPTLRLCRVFCVCFLGAVLVFQVSNEGLWSTWSVRLCTMIHMSFICLHVDIQILQHQLLKLTAVVRHIYVWVFYFIIFMSASHMYILYHILHILLQIYIYYIIHMTIYTIWYFILLFIHIYYYISVMYLEIWNGNYPFFSLLIIAL